MLRVTAAAAVLAAGAGEAAPAASAGRSPEPTPAAATARPNRVHQTLEARWRSMVAGAEALAARRQAGADIGSVAVTTSQVVFNDGEKGTGTQIQSDAYDKSGHTLEEYVIEINTPEGQAAGSGMRPNDLFQITLYEDNNGDAPVPPTTDSFSEAIDGAGSASGNSYHFSLDEPKAGDLEVLAHQETGPALFYSTDPTVTMQHSIRWNANFVNALLDQAGQVEHGAAHQAALPPGEPEVLTPRYVAWLNSLAPANV